MVTPDLTAEVKARVGGKPSIVDGASASIAADSWAKIDLPIVQDLHLQDVFISFTDCEQGDRGFAGVFLLSANTNLESAASIDDTTISIPVAVAPYYDPSSGARYVEFWDDTDSNLVEVREIDSVDGGTVTLSSALTNDHTTSAQLRVSYGYYSQVRGTDGTDQGAHLIGAASLNIGDPNEITEAIPVGMTVSARIKTVAGGTDRKFAINYKFRDASTEG